jgi:hypothetical protein
MHSPPHIYMHISQCLLFNHAQELVQWFRLALTKRPKSVGRCLPEDGKRSSFRNVFSNPQTQCFSVWYSTLRIETWRHNTYFPHNNKLHRLLSRSQGPRNSGNWQRTNYEQLIVYWIDVFTTSHFTKLLWHILDHNVCNVLRKSHLSKLVRLGVCWLLLGLLIALEEHMLCDRSLSYQAAFLTEHI